MRWLFTLVEKLGNWTQKRDEEAYAFYLACVRENRKLISRR